MSTTVKSTNRSLVALSLAKSDPALLTYADDIVKRMTGNASFPNPAPTPAAVTAGHAQKTGRRAKRWNLSTIVPDLAGPQGLVTTCA